MLRLTLLSQTPAEVVLALDGKVVEGAVRLLEQEAGPHLGQVHRLVLDVEGVQHIEPAGITLLKCWSREGLVLRGGSLYIRALLQAHGLASELKPTP